MRCEPKIHFEKVQHGAHPEARQEIKRCVQATVAGDLDGKKTNPASRNARRFFLAILYAL